MSSNSSSSAVDGHILCVICGGSSDGKHFGCFTCRPCAAFFRRTVSLRLKYKCYHDGKCGVRIEDDRNICRSCRFDKCLRVGMVPDKVQQQRDKLGSRRGKKDEPSPTVDTPAVVDASNICVDIASMGHLVRLLEGYHAFLAQSGRGKAVGMAGRSGATVPEDPLQPSNFWRVKRRHVEETGLVMGVVVEAFLSPFAGELDADEKV